MRRQSILLLGVIACGCAVATSAQGLTGPKTLSFLDVSSNNVQPINGFTFSRMPRAGDQFPIEDTLYRWAGTKRGARVGNVEGIGTFQVVGSNSARVLFEAQAHVPGGSIVIQGYGTVIYNGPSRFTFPVVGGTGAYANARGVVSVRDIGNGNGNNSTVIFHLTA